MLRGYLFYLVVGLFLTSALLPCTVAVTAEMNVQKTDQASDVKPVDNKPDVPPLVLSQQPVPNTNNTNVDKKASQPGSNESSATETKHKPDTFKKEGAEIESGALIRGLWVMAGIGLLFIVYVGIKTYRKGNKQVAIVRKYGVRTRRNDVEMEPLPLDDDEDETVFDLGNFNNRA